MPRRYFNWKLAIVVVIGLAVLAATAFGLRRWQRANRTEQRLALGNKAYEEQRWEEAASNLGRYIAVEQDDVPALLKYAEAQLHIRPLKSNNVQQAIAAYRTASRVDKNNPEAATKLTEIYLGMGMPGEAELIAKRYLGREHSLQNDSKTGTQTNKDLELRRMLAVALANQRKFNEAAVELKSIITEHPEQISAYETLGRLTEQRLEDFPESPAYWFNEAVKNNPSSALAYIIRAGFHLRSKDRLKALADLAEAEKQDLSDPLVRLRLAGEFINANVLDKAEEHLTAVQSATPADQALWQIWAQLALKSQSQKKMLKVAETGLTELSSQPWDFLPIAAELFITCGEFDRASDCLKKLKQKDIALDTVAALEGLIASGKGHTYEAVKCWRRSMELGNKSTRIRLALVSALSKLGDTQSAIQQLRTLVSEQPNSFTVRLALANLLAQTGNWAEPREHALRATQLSPENLQAALLYLRAQIQLLVASSAGRDAQTWQDIKEQLSALEKATKGTAEVILLQLHLALQQGNFTDAQALVTRLKEEHPSQLTTSLAEAELLVAQDKTNEAILILNETIKEFPETVEPVRYLAVLLDRQGNQEKCEAIIKDALVRIEQPAAHRKLGLLLAELYTRWNQRDNVYTLLSSLAQKLPNDIPIKRWLLVSEPVIKNPRQAQKLIDDIKLLEGENGWQWRYEQARVWFAASDFKTHYPQIISLLQENLLANPDDQASRMLMAAAYNQAGEVQLALSTYREALNRWPDDLRIIIPTVDALSKARKYDEAEQILSRASAQKLQHPRLQRLQLDSYLRHGELSSASDILKDMLSNEPNNQAVCFALALVDMQQNKLTEAGELLAKLKAQDPNSLPVTYAQVRLNIRQNKPEESLKLCNEIINSLNNASAYILRARTYQMLKQADKAAEDLEHATAIEPNNVEVWVARSEFYRSIGRPDLALSDIQQALSLAPVDVQIQKLAVSLFLAADNPDGIRQGKTILNNALESNPEDIELRLFKARSLLTEGTAPAIENAEQILQKITEDQPETAQAWVLLGEISLRQGQPGKAIDAALRGLAHKSNDRALLLLKARAEAERSPILAIPTLKLLLELYPNDVDTVLLLAHTYIAAGEAEKAVNHLKTQLASHRGTPDERRINIALAVALYKNGNKADAQKEFDSLLQSEPNDPGPLLAQAPLLRDDQLWNRLYERVTDWYQKHPNDSRTPLIIARDLVTTEGSEVKKTAEDILRMILKNDPDYTAAMAVLALLLPTTGRSEEAAQLYTQILTIEPDNVIAMNNLAWIMCEEREEQDKYQQALELTQRGLKIAPDYIDLIDTRGVVYYRMGELNKAIQDFNMCITLYPKGTPAAVASRFHLARALAGLRQRDKAVEQLNQTLDLQKRFGGLLAADLAEAQRLLEQLQEGS